MWRYLGGAASALVLMAAGFFLLKSVIGTDRVIASAPASTGQILSFADNVTPPEADEKSKEEKRFNRFDKDKNGAINRDEYLLSRRKAYAKLDTNGDGTVSFDEYAIKTSAKFGKADGDKSGILNRTEFATTRVIRKSKPKANCPPVAPHQAEAAEDGDT